MDIRELKGFTRGQIDATLMKIGQDAGMGTAEGIEAFLRGDLVASRPTCRFREKDGVIYLTVTSDGTTGEDWIKILGENNLSKYAKEVLRSKDFQPTTGVIYQVKVLKGFYLIGHDSKGNPDLSPLLEDIDAKAPQAVDLIAHVHFPVLDESLLLPVVHEPEGHLRDVVMIEGFELLPGS